MGLELSEEYLAFGPCSSTELGHLACCEHPEAHMGQEGVRVELSGARGSPEEEVSTGRARGHLLGHPGCLGKDIPH